MHPYQVSVIMAVHNVAPFLPEAIESIIAQNIGFQNIQLILVDDGSTDESGAICDDYAARYPENILALHKENGGVSSARNAGLRYARGKYLNFMDADDTLSDNVCSKVTAFFDHHYDDIDAAAFPMFFFDGKSGPHILNNKFSKGSRIIDLRKEFDMIQLSTASCFLKRETVQRLGLRYDERLSFTEDAKLLAELLTQTMRLGVVSTCRYRVRRRSGAAPSATQQSGARKEWWLDTLNRFQMDTIRYSLDRLGYLPRYVQYLLCYDLQWRLQQKAFPKELLTDEEIAQYRSLLAQVLSYLDDDIVWMQKYIWREHKIYALRLKYGRDPEMIHTRENIQYYYGEHEILSLMDYGLNLSFLDLNREFCRIDGFLMLFPPALEGIRLEVRAGEAVYPCTPIPGPKEPRILDDSAQISHGFSVRIPLSGLFGSLSITFHAIHGSSCVEFHQLRLGKFFPLSRKYDASYCCRDGFLAVCRKNTLVISPRSFLARGRSELRFLRELYRKNQTGGRKAVVGRILYHFLHPFKRKPLFLLSDRLDRAGDNAEAMFRFLRSNHKKEVHAVFAVSRESPDFRSLKKTGPVVASQSLLHKLLHLLCDYNLSSGAEVHTVNPFAGYEANYADLLSRVKFVFLQHGITKDDISGWINRYDKNIFGLVCAARAEHDAFGDSRYCYPEENIWLTGFPRFDRLFHAEQNCIAIVPTWRKQLMGTMNPHTGVWSVCPGFSESEFVRFYRALLRHPRLHDALQTYGYTLQFLPHPNLRGAISEFQVPEWVEVLNADTQYRDLYARSKLIVTDYSSAVFDFTYLRKPVVYCQFDADIFFSGAHSYEKGYFDYGRDGFGEVTYTLEDTVDCLIHYMASDCRMKPKYRERADRFFAFQDQENCRRVYEKIMESYQ